MKLTSLSSAIGHIGGVITIALLTIALGGLAVEMRGSVRTGGCQDSDTKRHKTGQMKWHIPTYQGLVLGKSTVSDVVRAFGKPIWSGSPIYDEPEGEVRSELLYEYRNVGGFKGQTSVYSYARTKKIKAVSLYPDYEFPLRVEQIIKQYGTDYIERESDLGPCPTSKEVRDFKPPQDREYPNFLVYPGRGMYVTVREDGSVAEIGYLSRCP